MEGINAMASLAMGGGVSEGNLSELRRTAFALSFALLALNALDLTVTSFNIEYLGAIELNRIVAPLLGTPWVVMLKIGIPVLTVILAARVRSSWILTFLRIAVSIYLAVVIVGVGQLAFALV
jgi:hypothetical protein